MLNWLKNKIRKWLAEEDGPPAPVLEAIISGRPVRVVPKGAVGMGLLCRVPAECGTMQRLFVLEFEAVDQDIFWKLWKRLGGSAVWEGGDRFEPGGLI